MPIILFTMSEIKKDANIKIGKVVSLHLHPPEKNDKMITVESFYAVAGKGITGQPPRYYGKVDRKGFPNKNHISLIQQEEIIEHALMSCVDSFPPGVVRSNIECTGIKLVDLIGYKVSIGKEVVVHFYRARTPCKQMDDICHGLQRLMKNKKQGVIAEIIKSGKICIGDEIVCNLLTDKI
ncbi:MAG: hypothetical protein Edafosvirus11_28 [Edafosvirus sp.]|uniref:MOSC domain-containing protein n=1 Tax=Edafosvirus sp. TaxID=2487765 RepID=A0A3G4ZXR7_9VIRU|nr:MAG: hypothetical protein Edafosvirus11_28 [Edafosvirus sp.]